MWSDNEAKEDLLGFQYLADGIISIVKNRAFCRRLSVYSVTGAAANRH